MTQWGCGWLGRMGGGYEAGGGVPRAQGGDYEAVGGRA